MSKKNGAARVEATGHQHWAARIPITRFVAAKPVLYAGAGLVLGAGLSGIGGMHPIAVSVIGASLFIAVFLSIKLVDFVDNRELARQRQHQKLLREARERQRQSPAQVIHDRALQRFRSRLAWDRALNRPLSR